MPAIAAVAIPAAAAVVGGIIQHKTAGNAAKQAQQASNDALTYQKGRDQTSDQRYNDAWKDYQMRHSAWERRNFGGGQPQGGGGGGFTPTPAFAAGQGQIMDPGSLGSLIGQQPQQQQLSAQEQPAAWNDWRGLGLVQ